MKINRYMSFLSLYIIATILLVSCLPGSSQTEPPSGGAPAQSSGAKASIKLATWAGVDEATELQGLLDKLNAASSSYTITQESSPSEYWTKVQTTIAGGTAADLLWVDQEHMPDLASKGALLDVTELIKSDSKNPAAKLDDYFDATTLAFTYQEKMYGLPWIGMPAMLYVNLDYVKAAGYDENTINDWTWDDFQTACIKMTLDAQGNTPDAPGFDATSIKQYGFSVTPGWPPLQQYIWQAGGEVITPDLKTSPVDSPEAIQGAQYLADLVNKYKCTPSQSVISERGFGDMMKSGQVAMFVGGAADDLERSEGKHIKAFLLPQGPKNRDSWAYIAGMAINAKTKSSPDVVYQAFMDLTQAIQEWKVPAPRKSLATAEGIIKAASYKQESAENIIANMSNMRAPYIFPGYAEWGTVFSDRFFDPLVRGTGAPADLAKEVRPLLDGKLPK